MDGIERTEDQIREANELYWESETSVNRIADRLGLSKGSLYAAIEPLASESICPLCSERLVYNNRTALEKGQLQCSSCGTEFSEKAGTAGERSARAAAKVTRRPAAAETPVPPSVPSVAPSTTPDTNGQYVSDGPSRQLVLSTTMLGLGFGLLLRRVFRR